MRRVGRLFQRDPVAFTLVCAGLVFAVLTVALYAATLAGSGAISQTTSALTSSVTRQQLLAPLVPLTATISLGALVGALFTRAIGRSRLVAAPAARRVRRPRER